MKKLKSFWNKFCKWLATLLGYEQGIVLRNDVPVGIRDGSKLIKCGVVSAIAEEEIELGQILEQGEAEGSVRPMDGNFTVDDSNALIKGCKDIDDSVRVNAELAEAKIKVNHLINECTIKAFKNFGISVEQCATTMHKMAKAIPEDLRIKLEAEVKRRSSFMYRLKCYLPWCKEFFLSK